MGVKSIIAPLLTLFFLTLVFLGAPLPAAEMAAGQKHLNAALPAFFLPNAHLAGMEVSYLAQSPEWKAAFEKNQVRFEIHGKTASAQFLGASPEATIGGMNPLPGRANFLTGNDAAQWSTGVPMFGGVRYTGLYPGIDLTYSADASRVKAEYRVNPGAHVSDIRLRYSGLVEIAANGDLVVHTGDGELREKAPVLYQMIHPGSHEDGSESRRAIAGKFTVLDAHTVGFAVGDYDASLPLIIDPVISYSTFLGGSGMGAVTGIATDSSGNLYATGWTEALNFPIAGAAQASNGGGVDAFIVKLNAAGSAITYATYIGGKGDDRAAAIAVKSNGEAWVTGATSSYNFPTVSPLRSTLGGSRTVFVLRLNSTGNTLLNSTYLGGTAYELGTGIVVDSSGAAYVTGNTQSLNFPLLNAYQSTIGGRTDAFVTKLNSTGTAMVYSTYLGGVGDETASGIVVDTSGNAYVTGGTTSPNYPLVTPILNTLQGNQDAFVTKLNSTGSALVYSTYLGGSGTTGSELANGLAVDSTGTVYVAGTTNSSNFPTTSGTYQRIYGGSQDGFVARINAAGSALLFCTYLGGSNFDWANAVGFDSSGNTYVAGYTSSTNFGVANALQGALNGPYDAFIMTFNSTATAVTFSTYYGGSTSDVVNAMVVDANGNIYVAGQTNSTDLPLQGAIQSNNSGGAIGWVAKLGSTTVPTQQPGVGSVSPGSGTGNAVTFTAAYTDTGGATALTTVGLLINTVASGDFGCYVTYDRAANLFALANDTVSSGSATLPPGGGIVQNSQCTLSGSTSSVSISGNTLTATISVGFLPGFQGAKTVYLNAKDAGADTGWVSKAAWTVTIPSPQPSADSVSPSGGSGASQVFNFVFSDSQSVNNLTGMVMLFATSVGTQNACYISYDRVVGRISLLWDSGLGSDSRPITGSTALRNSQCTVGISTATITALSYVVSVTVTFKPAYAGQKNIYMYATNGSINSGWVQRGTFLVAAPGTPQATSVVPTSGSGPAQRFTFTINEPGGSSYLTGLSALINDSSSTLNGCFLNWDRANNRITLSYDNPANGGTPVDTGTNAVAVNSQCSLRALNSTVIVGTTSIAVTLDLAFSGSWAGAKNIYLLAAETGFNSGLQLVGSWTVTGGAPTADSISPSSGSGSTPTFNFTVSDSASDLNITGMGILFTVGAPTNTANACYLLYNRTNATIGLYDDAGATLNTKGIGSSASLQNSQCQVGFTVMTRSGTSVILQANLVFKPAFTGTKTVYLRADETAVNSGWVSRGTWTVP